MFKSASTMNELYDRCQADPRYEEVLRKYFDDKNQRDEFRQHLWLQICENDHIKVLTAFAERWFIWFYVSICKNQIISNDSAWHTLYRKNKVVDYIDNYDSDEQDEHQDEDEQFCVQEKKEQIADAIQYYESKGEEFTECMEAFKQHFYKRLPCRKIKIVRHGKELTHNTVNLQIGRAKHLILWHIKKDNKLQDN